MDLLIGTFVLRPYVFGFVTAFLVAGALVAGDEEFAVLFAEFVRDHAAGADQPLDPRLHEIVGNELQPFAG